MARRGERLCVRGAASWKLALAIALGVTGVCATYAVSDELGILAEQPAEPIEAVQAEADATDGGIEVLATGAEADDALVIGADETSESDEAIVAADASAPEAAPIVNLAAAPAEGVRYVDESGEAKTANGCTDISSDSFKDEKNATLNSGWYVVKSSCEFKNRIEAAGEVRLIIADGATATFTKGIRVQSGSLTVYGGSAKGGKLVAKGQGKCAGIGSDKGNDCGKVTIVSGAIEAEGGGLAAGIGAGQDGGCGEVRILGGIVTATGGTGAYGGGAGIGTADDSERGGSVIISGGEVTAKGGEYAAGIGTGDEAKAGLDVTITGGTVLAEAGHRAAGIGSGNEAPGCNITISGGSVTAKRDVSAGMGASIGGGYMSGAGNITISGGEVNAKAGFEYGVDTSATGGAGIGSGGKAKDGGRVTITGGTVTAVGGTSAAGIGMGDAANKVVDVEITGGVVTAKGVYKGPGIGGAEDRAAGTVTIAGDTVVKAKAGEMAAGIGGGDDGGSGRIAISGNANVEAQGSDGGAGIGGGDSCGGADISISGNAKVKATGGEKDGAGIGGGDGGEGGRITISGNADVTAQGAHNGAGIGGGDNHAGGLITIEDSAKIVATGGTRAAGIGGGDDGKSGIIAIDGCARIEATGKDGAASIGRGQSGGKTSAVLLAEGYDVSGEFGGDGKFVQARDFERLGFLALCPHVVVEPTQKPAEQAQPAEQPKPSVGVIALNDDYERIGAPIAIATSEDGSEVTLTACELEGYEFQCWRDACFAEDGTLSGVLAPLGTEATLTYKLEEHPVVCAVYKAVASQTENNDDAQAEESKANEGTDEGQAEMPSTYENGDKNRESGCDEPSSYDAADRAHLRAAALRITISCLDTEGAELAAERTADCVKGQAIAATAPEVEDKTFLRWEDVHGGVLGYSRRLETVPTGNTELLAIYGDAAEESRPVISISRQYRAEQGDARGVGAQVTRFVPEGWELVEQGVLYARDFNGPTEKNFTLGVKGVELQKSTNGELSGTTRVIVTVSDDKVKVTQRGYMKVKSRATGKEETLYTGIVTSSYSNESMESIVY